MLAAIPSASSPARPKASVCKRVSENIFINLSLSLYLRIHFIA